MRELDHASIAVLGNLLFAQMTATRKGDMPRILDLRVGVAAFRELYPAASDFWDEHFDQKVTLALPPPVDGYHRSA
jgi:hypothetical protein